jgi:hypothetical protein
MSVDPDEIILFSNQMGAGISIDNSDVRISLVKNNSKDSPLAHQKQARVIVTKPLDDSPSEKLIDITHRVLNDSEEETASLKRLSCFSVFSVGDKSANGERDYPTLDNTDSSRASAKNAALDPVKPLNAAMLALQKRRNKGSTSSISSHDRRSSGGSSFCSNTSMDNFFGPNASSLRKSGSFHSSPHNMSKKAAQFEEKVQKLKHSIKTNLILNSLPMEKQKDKFEIKKRKELISQYRMKKFNSTGTLFADSCIVNSDVDEFLKYFSYYIQSVMKQNHGSLQHLYTVDILSEQIHPLSVCNSILILETRSILQKAGFKERYI